MRRGALLALLPLTLAACGGASGGDLASKSPKQILADTASAMRKVRTYHVDGVQLDKDGRTHLVGDVSAAGAVRFRLENRAQVTQLVVAGGKTYIRGNRAFWRAQRGSISARIVNALTDRWVQAPGGVSKDLKRSLGELQPKTLADCVGRDVGTLSKRGPMTFEGHDVVVLVDKGDGSSNEPGELYIPTKGPALPMRVRQTGPRRPGGHVDLRCDDPTSTTRSSDTRLSAFDEPLHITAPHGAVDLNTLFGGAPVS